MAVTIKIFVEGIADVKFLKDYISRIAPGFEIAKKSKYIVFCGDLAD